MAIAAKKFDVFDRQIQPVAAGIFQQKAFMRRTRRRDRFQPLEAPHPVIDMHHQIAGAQRLRLGQIVVGALHATLGPDQPVAQDILFRNHRQARAGKPLVQGPDHKT